MSTTYTQVIAVVRGLVVDQVELDVVNAFTDTEIVTAINLAKNDFFGRRPEAFSLSSVVVEPPADITIGGIATVCPINDWAIRTYCFGVASFLLRQRGKDAYYRKAADAMGKAYIEG